MRYSGPATNLALFAENTAAAAILDGATPAQDSVSLAYLQRLRNVTRKQFAWVVYRDTSSNPVASFDDDAPGSGSSENLYIATVPVRDARGHAIGRVDAAVRMDRSTRVLRSTCASGAAAARRCSTRRQGSLSRPARGRLPCRRCSTLSLPATRRAERAASHIEGATHRSSLRWRPCRERPSPSCRSATWPSSADRSGGFVAPTC